MDELPRVLRFSSGNNWSHNKTRRDIILYESVGHGSYYSCCKNSWMVHCVLYFYGYDCRVGTKNKRWRHPHQTTVSMTTDDVTRRGYSVSIYIRGTKTSFRPTAKQRSCVDGRQAVSTTSSQWRLR